MLFMRSDTVAEAVAKGHSLSKGELLDHEGAQSMAVRLALGETHVIDQTKKMLRENGVNVAALEVEKKPEQRSKTALIVKNIPHSTEDHELRDLFARFGDLGRLVLPQTKTMALVEFDEPTEARKAFRQLAYSKFKNQPIYLEWAPENIFDDLLDPDAAAARKEKKDQKIAASSSKHQTAPDSAPAHQSTASAAGDVAAEGDKGSNAKATTSQTMTPPAGVDKSGGKSAGGEAASAGGGAGATLYVKNLSFDTKEEALKRAMAQGGKVKAVKIMMKANPKDKSAKLHGLRFC